MKKLLVVFTCAVIIFQSCKKEDGDYSGTVSNTIIPTAPPPGFSFPRTYKVTGSTEDFHVWINDIDRTSSYKASYFFGKGQNPFDGISFKLIDKNKIQAIDLSGQQQPSEAGYYFYRDTLYIIDRDTFAFAKGNYYGFSIPWCEYKISGEDNFGSYVSNQGSDITKLTKEQLREQYSFLNKIDTLALYNRLTQYN